MDIVQLHVTLLDFDVTVILWDTNKIVLNCTWELLLLLLFGWKNALKLHISFISDRKISMAFTTDFRRADACCDICRRPMTTDGTILYVICVWRTQLPSIWFVLWSVRDMPVWCILQIHLMFDNLKSSDSDKKVRRKSLKYRKSDSKRSVGWTAGQTAWWRDDLCVLNWKIVQNPQHQSVTKSICVDLGLNVWDTPSIVGGSR